MGKMEVGSGNAAFGELRRDKGGKKKLGRWEVEKVGGCVAHFVRRVACGLEERFALRAFHPGGIGFAFHRVNFKRAAL